MNLALDQAAILVTPQNKATQDTPIMGAIGVLGKNIEQLHAMLSELRERMELVLSPLSSVKKAEITDRPPAPERARLTHQVYQSAEGVNNACEKIADLLERLEA